MPSQSHSGWSGVPWYRCQRCGIEYHVSQLRRQGGLIVCQVTCFDIQGTVAEQDNLRQSQIRMRLSDPATEPELAEILKQTPQDLDAF